MHRSAEETDSRRGAGRRHRRTAVGPWLIGAALVVGSASGMPPARAGADVAGSLGAASTAGAFTVALGADRLLVQVCGANVLHLTYEPKGLPAPHTLVVADRPCVPVAASLTR